MQDFTKQLADLQANLNAIRQMSSNPQLLQQVLAGQVPQVPQPQSAQLGAASEQSVTLTKQQEALLALYDEFAKTDDGKALAIGLSKFAKFAQSKVAK